MQRHIRKIVVFTLVCVYSVELASGVKFTGNHFIDIFMHGNVFHLFLCCYCLWEMLHDWPMRNIHMLVFGIAAATIATYISPYSFQGTSGIIFALTGLRLSAYPTKRNYIAVTTSLAFCTLIQPSSLCVHGVPLVLAFLYYRMVYGKA